MEGRLPGIAAAKDLAAESPRPYDAELDGYAWLPRMLDKARAARAGTAGDHMFGCPVDHTCAARLGVPVELIGDLAAQHADDEAVLAALRQHGIPSAAEAWFDGPAVEDEAAGGTYLRVRHRDALADGAFHGEEHGAGVSVVLVALEPDEAEPSHRHAVEEVAVVTQGLAVVRLGDYQARRVGPDEVVRIPAGVPHRIANAGEETLRVVAVQPGGRAAMGIE
jgi:quercetin dioxygenase-like cupin family protein